MGNVFVMNWCNKRNTNIESESTGPHGVTAHAITVSALAHDLLHFQVTSQVPEGLSNDVVSSKKDQANWYARLLEAWKDAKPPPRNPEEATRLIIQTLQGHKSSDVEGLLIFYGLPLPNAMLELSNHLPPSLPKGVEFELRTLPVDEKAVVDGDGMAVYVSTADPRESSMVPSEVQAAAVKRSKSLENKNYTQADELHNEILDQNYMVMEVQNEEVLARKYWIRLRGIDAPESAMPYGQEAKEELAKLVRGKCLSVLVYGKDRYGRSIGDVFCNGTFAQEMMLKKGLAWHNTANDDRAQLANWEKQARAKRVGLWASSNPEEPWNWRRDRSEGRY